MSLLAAIKEYATAIGFDACGAARAQPLSLAALRLDEWLARDFHAGMGYMERYRDLRTNPAALVEGARSVIVCLVSYQSGDTYPPDIPQIAAYARFGDYHFTVRKMLDELLARIRTLAPGSDGRVFVDSAPVAEKSWAVEAGLGWQGRNSLLIHPKMGSYCFLGTILTNLELDEYDPPYVKNHCATCRRCVEACPTGAITGDGMVDCRACLSFQTIENRGPIPEALLPALSDRLFGCDACQQACPWNEQAPPARHPSFQADTSLYTITRQQWQEMTSGTFHRRFAHTPLSRAGLKKIKQTLQQTIEYPTKKGAL